MGEILGQSPELALEYNSILFSYLDPDGNYLEHEMLQRGVLWGVGTYLESNPLDLNEKTKGLLLGYLQSLDPVKRGYAVRALINSKCFDCSLVPENIVIDNHRIDLFNDWNFYTTCISDMALSWKSRKIFA